MLKKIWDFLLRKKEVSVCCPTADPTPKMVEKEYNCCGGKVKVKRPVSKRKSRGKK